MGWMDFGDHKGIFKISWDDKEYKKGDIITIKYNGTLADLMFDMVDYGDFNEYLRLVNSRPLTEEETLKLEEQKKGVIETWHKLMGITRNI